jgi:hypothetical protein
LRLTEGIIPSQYTYKSGLWNVEKSARSAAIAQNCFPESPFPNNEIAASIVAPIQRVDNYIDFMNIY